MRKFLRSALRLLARLLVAALRLAWGVAVALAWACYAVLRVAMAVL